METIDTDEEIPELVKEDSQDKAIGGLTTQSQLYELRREDSGHHRCGGYHHDDPPPSSHLTAKRDKAGRIMIGHTSEEIDILYSIKRSVPAKKLDSTTSRNDGHEK